MWLAWLGCSGYPLPPTFPLGIALLCPTDPNPALSSQDQSVIMRPKVRPVCLELSGEQSPKWDGVQWETGRTDRWQLGSVCMCHRAAWPLCQGSLLGVLIFACIVMAWNPFPFALYMPDSSIPFSSQLKWHLHREAFPDCHNIHPLSLPWQVIQLLLASFLALSQPVIVFLSRQLDLLIESARTHLKAQTGENGSYSKEEGYVRKGIEEELALALDMEGWGEKHFLNYSY